MLPTEQRGQKVGSRPLLRHSGPARPRPLDGELKKPAKSACAKPSVSALESGSLPDSRKWIHAPHKSLVLFGNFAADPGTRILVPASNRTAHSAPNSVSACAPTAGRRAAQGVEEAAIELATCEGWIPPTESRCGESRNRPQLTPAKSALAVLGRSPGSWEQRQAPERCHPQPAEREIPVWSRLTSTLRGAAKMQTACRLVVSVKECRHEASLRYGSLACLGAPRPDRLNPKRKSGWSHPATYSPSISRYRATASIPR